MPKGSSRCFGVQYMDHPASFQGSACDQRQKA